MQTVYIGSTLVNDVMLGSQRMDDVLTPKDTLNIEYLVVAGGGGGNYGAATIASRSGGGGAGGLRSGSLLITSTPLSLSATVGSGGAGGDVDGSPVASNGQNSSLIGGALSVTCTGGGRGGNGFGETGANGGSGGGGGGSTGQAGGTGTSGEGFSGGAAPGQGGSPISNGSSNNRSIVNGATWLDGIEYACGGGSGQSAGTLGGDQSTLKGSGGGGGALGGDGGDGVDGVVIIRYFGTTRATGGTITQTGGYTYHTFTTSGTFTY
jgi:hypothetical protein